MDGKQSQKDRFARRLMRSNFDDYRLRKQQRKKKWLQRVSLCNKISNFRVN